MSSALSFAIVSFTLLPLPPPPPPLHLSSSLSLSPFPLSRGVVERGVSVGKQRIRCGTCFFNRCAIEYRSTSPLSRLSPFAFRYSAPLISRFPFDQFPFICVRTHGSFRSGARHAARCCAAKVNRRHQSAQPQVLQPFAPFADPFELRFPLFSNKRLSQSVHSQAEFCTCWARCMSVLIQTNARKWLALFRCSNREYETL